MRKANKSLWLVACVWVFTLSTQAQTPNGATLNQAIEHLKSKKSQELNLGARLYSGSSGASAAPSSPVTPTKTAPPPAPQLWSIRGIGNDLRAEVLYRGRIQEIRLSQPARLLGGWTLVALSEQEATFARQQTDRASGPRLMRLQVMPIDDWVLSMSASIADLDASTTTGSAASRAAAPSDQRPPVPSELLKP